MKVSFIDINNFRKLEQCRIELNNEKTVFVGANNSGKTSAMNALEKFLIPKNKNDFVFNDFFVAKKPFINKIGAEWSSADAKAPEDIKDWSNIIPVLDIWLNIDNSLNELQFVAHIIPTLQWKGGLLGIRYSYQPTDIQNLFSEYRLAYFSARETENHSKNHEENKIYLWPKNLCEFLEKNNELQKYFKIKAYILNPEKSIEKNQVTSDLIECLESDPLKGLIKIDMIPAQRGFADVETVAFEESKVGGSLSSQLRSYYDKHLDPEKSPTPEDVDTLLAMDKATIVFNQNLKSKFKSSIDELEQLGYPGVANPKIEITTKVSAVETLKHDSAVKYMLSELLEDELSLPEKYNGLGYQNLISIVFQLMRFRDDWLKTGKAKKATSEELTIEPIHLVLLEEPEAHLHVQVQQVLIREAINVLQNSDYLRKYKGFTTQLIVSTHSSHIAKECPFTNLRYFKRLPASDVNKVGTSTVVNLSDVFGDDKETAKFVTRYLQTTHCDLFFADAVILIEGTAEEMLLPHFIKTHYKKLGQRYLSTLRIMGRHTHTLAPLLNKLAIPTLVIADLDSCEKDGHHCKVAARRGQSQISTNYTINGWLIKEKDLDKLLDVKSEQKVINVEMPIPYSIRIAYQNEIPLEYKSECVKAIPRTFEDSLIYTNLTLFIKKIEESNNQDENIEASALKIIYNAITSSDTFDKLHDMIFKELNTSSVKALLALDLIYEFDISEITPPEYICEGLSWLQEQLNAIE